jgi:predicted peptidase
MRHPDRFAALVPIAGGWRFGTPRSPAALCNLRDTPLWAFHGAVDEIVPAERTTVFVEQLRACGGTPRFTLYPGVGHESWTRAYASPALWRWLFAQRRG